MCSVTSYSLCGSIDYSPPGSSTHGIFQVRILEWVAISYTRGFSWPRYQTLVSWVSALAGRFFTTSATWEARWSRSSFSHIVVGFKLQAQLLQIWILNVEHLSLKKQTKKISPEMKVNKNYVICRGVSNISNISENDCQILIFR